MNKKILSGSFWLSFGSIFSRVLGVVYLIPWLIMLGSYQNQLNAQAIFNVSYTPYALFLAIGTAGLPSVIAREVAAFNSKNQYRDSVYLTKIGIIVMIIMGILCGAMLYFIAPLIAQNSPVASIKEATHSIRLLVPAVVLIPSMSMLRGWFQGNNDMKPYGISQLWEQFARILFILISTFVIIKVFHKNYVTAVNYSVTGAVIGAIVSYVYLIRYAAKQRHEYSTYLVNSVPKANISLKQSLLKLWYESIPFVLLGAFITLTQFVDQVFFKQIMVDFLHHSQNYVSYIYTIFSANPSKVTTVVISLATAVSETSLPLLAALKTQKEKSQAKKFLMDNYELLIFVLLPIIIMGVCGAPYIYTILFSYDPVGIGYLIDNLIQALLVGLGINVLTLYLALNKNRQAIFYMILSLIIKIILQFPLTYLFEASGAIVSTNLAFVFVIFIGYSKLNREYNISLNKIGKLFVVSIVWGIVLTILTSLLTWLHLPITRLISSVFLGMIGLIGIISYILVMNLTGISEEIFGRKISLTLLIDRMPD